MGRISKKAIREARFNKSQYILNPRQKAVAVPRPTVKIETVNYEKQVYYCPFCLYFGGHREFETLTKKGKPSKKIICPACKNGMLNRTLTTKMTAEQYAEFVYMYSSSGFWQKINFEQWKERLNKLGMAKQFWDKYKLLKGTGERTETYTEHMEHEQEQWAKEQGLI